VKEAANRGGLALLSGQCEDPQEAGSPPCVNGDPERNALFKLSMMHQRDWSTAGKKKHGFAVGTITTSTGTDRA
jgi:hypothetical protein